MKTIEEFYAGDGSVVLIDTVELSCPAWPEPIRLRNGYVDEVLGGQLYKAAPIAVILPEESARGTQSVKFVIDNITGEAQQHIDLALDSAAIITMTYRAFLSDHKSAPAIAPVTATIIDAAITASRVNLNASFYDTLANNFNRVTYNSDTAPCIKYL